MRAMIVFFLVTILASACGSPIPERRTRTLEDLTQQLKGWWRPVVTQPLVPKQLREPAAAVSAQRLSPEIMPAYSIPSGDRWVKTGMSARIRLRLKCEEEDLSITYTAEAKRIEAKRIHDVDVAEAKRKYKHKHWAVLARELDDIEADYKDRVQRTNDEESIERYLWRQRCSSVVNSPP